MRFGEIFRRSRTGKRSRGGGSSSFWLFAGVLVVSLAIGGYFLMERIEHSNSIILLNSTEVANESSSQNTNRIENTYTIAADSVSTKAIGKVSESPSLAENNKPITSTNTSSIKNATIKAKGIKSTTSSSTSKENTSLRSNSIENVNSNTNSKDVADKTENANPNPIGITSSKENSNSTASISSTENQITKDHSTLISTSETDLKTKELTSIPAPDYNNQNSQQSIYDVFLDLNSLSILLEIPDFAVTAGVEKSPDISSTKEIAKPIKPTARKSPFSIGGHFAYGFANRKLSAKTAENQTYKLVRDSMETARQVLSGGLDFQWQLKSGWYAKTGLYYEQINERFDYRSVDTSTVFDENQLVSEYQRMDGRTIDSTGANITLIRYLEKLIYNRYRTFDIPLLMGYSSISKKRFNWFAEAGVLVNVSFFPRGEILDEVGEFVDLKDEESLFKKSTGLSLTGAIGVSYRMTKNINLWASPTLRYQLGSMTTSENLVDQKFLRGAMQMGVWFYFNE